MNEVQSLMRSMERWNSTAEFYAVKRRQSYNNPHNLSVAIEMEGTYRGWIRDAAELIKKGLPMQSVKDEKALRKWLKDLWADDNDVQLTRLEPGLGCTMGVPDVLLLLKGGWLPIELKHGELKGGFLKCDIRPAQIQWHLSVAACGGKSLFLIGTERGIYAVPGKYVTQLATKKWEDWPQYTFSLIQLKHHFIALMEDERFWRGESMVKKELAEHVMKKDKRGSAVPVPEASVKCQSKSKQKPSKEKPGSQKAKPLKAVATKGRSSVAPKNKSPKTQKQSTRHKTKRRGNAS